MRFKVGDKVIVKSFSRRPMHWNPEGKMDKWMGKVVTIKSSMDEDSYLIKEDKEENSAFGWSWRENDLLPIPKPGDRVKIRTWADMANQYGIDNYGHIIAPRHSIVDGMNENCGKIVTVESVFRDNTFFLEENFNAHCWSFETIEQVYSKEERMTFIKSMLESGNHVVEYRNGERALYLKGSFISETGFMSIESYNNNLKLKDRIDDAEDFDIMAVYQVTQYLGFRDILRKYIRLLWRRDGEFIEIPATEAFAQLRGIYGKDVKIVEDRKA